MSHLSVYHALYLTEKFGTFKVGPRELPIPGLGEVIIKQLSIGLNPIDWKIQLEESAHLLAERDYPAILGFEGAGEIEVVGEGVTKFNKGDKVFHQGTWKNDNSTFQECVLVPADLVSRLPTNITFDQAASLFVAIAFCSPAPSGFGFAPPWDGKRDEFAGKPALILGGATSVGQYVAFNDHSVFCAKVFLLADAMASLLSTAIQFARLSGFSPIITTASLHNADLLKALGATHVIDRNTPASSFPSVIARITHRPIFFIYGAVSSEETQKLGYELLDKGGYLVIVLSPSVNEVQGSGKKILHVLGSIYVPGSRELGKAQAEHLPRLIEAGEITPNQVEVIPGGLNGIVPGLERLKNEQPC